MDLSIIIVNYNSYRHVKKCVNSIIENIDINRINYEIIVADSCSSELDINKIENEYSVKLIKCINKGFGYSNNRAAEISKGKLLMFLNPDTYLIDDSIIKMITFYNNNNFGIVSPLLLNEDRTIQYCHDCFHSFSYFIAEAFYYHGNRINKVISNDYNQIQKNFFEIDWALGAALLINRELFYSVGMFDESYFLYYEDTDLAKKITINGYKNVCFPFCKIIHVLSAASADKSFSKYHVHRSRLIYISKYFNLVQNILLRFIFILSLIFRFIIIPIKFKNKESNIKNIYRNLSLYFHRAVVNTKI